MNVCGSQNLGPAITKSSIKRLEMERLLQVLWIITWLCVQEGHFTQALQLPPGQMENEIATLCVIAKKTTQSAGYEQNLCPLCGRKAGTVLWKQWIWKRPSFKICPFKVSSERWWAAKCLQWLLQLSVQQRTLITWDLPGCQWEAKIQTEFKQSPGWQQIQGLALERDWMVLCCQWWSNHWISGFFSLFYYSN